MRNNKDRIGATVPSDSVNSSNAEPQQTNNLEFIVPTEIVLKQEEDKLWQKM